MFAATQPRKSPNSHLGPVPPVSAISGPSVTESLPYLVISLPPCFLFSKSFPCHTSENSAVSPSIATLPKTGVSKSNGCHTYETPRGAWTSSAFGLSVVYIPPAIHPLYFLHITHSFQQRAARNSFGIKLFRTLFILTGGVPPSGSNPGEDPRLLVVFRFQPLQQRLKKRLRRVGRPADGLKVIECAEDVIVPSGRKREANE